MNEKHVYGPFAHGADLEFARADLEFYGIDHYKPSFNTQIFFNDPEVNHENASDERASYAGSFSIFGHVICWGDEGHCVVPAGPPRRFDDRASHPLTRAFKRVVVTEALVKAIQDSDELTITLLVSSEDELVEEHHHHDHEHHEHHDMDSDRLLDFRGMQLVTFE